MNVGLVASLIIKLIINVSRETNECYVYGSIIELYYLTASEECIMENLFANISLEWIIIASVNMFLILVLFIMNLSNRSKLKKLRQKYQNFMSGLSENGNRNIEQLLNEYIERVNEVAVKNRDIENHINHIERNVMQCIQKVGVVRFNAFENVGSDLSFAIALLDSGDNGIVINGIYSRESSSTYAKPIIAGKSKYTLSAEEVQALDMAKKTYRERVYVDK